MYPNVMNIPNIHTRISTKYFIFQNYVGDAIPSKKTINPVKRNSPTEAESSASKRQKTIEQPHSPSKNLLQDLPVCIQECSYLDIKLNISFFRSMFTMRLQINLWTSIVCGHAPLALIPLSRSITP